jgi:hypothetical protein
MNPNEDRHAARCRDLARAALAMGDSPEVAARLAFYARACAEAAAALAEPDPDLDEERRIIADAQRDGA